MSLSIKTGLVTTIVTAGLFASALPAQAGGLRGAFLPGLLEAGIWAIAASVARAPEPANAYYADVPAEADGPEYWEENNSETRILSQGLSRFESAQGAGWPRRRGFSTPG